MPIRKELQHLYRGPVWRETRKRILNRAKQECEVCGKPNRRRVYVTRDGSGTWFPFAPSHYLHILIKDRTVHLIECVLTIAHLDHDPTNNADSNLKALCQACHLKHDQKFHFANARRTRARRVGQGWLSKEIEEGVRP